MDSRNTQKFFKRCLLLLVPVFFLAPQNVFAQIPYSFDFTGELYVWDISGTYNEDILNLGVGGAISYTISQDSKGKITGSGTANVNVDTIYGNMNIHMNFDIKGSVKQQNGVTTVKISFKFSGTATVSGETTKFNINAKVTMGINESTGNMNGTIAVGPVKGNFSMTGQPGMDGSSQLDFVVNINGKKLIGSGTVTLSNNDTYNFTVSGKFNSKTNESTFTFKAADNNANGCKLKITVNEGNGQTNSLNGSVLGQKFKQ